MSEKASIFKMPEQEKEAFAFFQKHGYSITQRGNYRVVLTKEWVEKAIRSGALKNKEERKMNNAL